MWLPFPDDDRSNLSILASGHRRDVDVEDQLRGPRFDLDMRPGDALFIPPLFPHLVRNFEGGSIAYGVNIISQASGKMMEEVRQLSPYDRAVFACHYLPADYPDEEWAANYSEETTEKALESCLQRVASVKPGLQETLRREAALKGREATVVTPTTPAVAREKPPAQPFAATRIGGVTSLADMAKVAAAVARAAPPPEPPKARLPPHYEKRRSSDDDKKAKADDKKKKRSRSRSRGRRRRKSPSRSRSSSSSRSRSRSPKKRRAARSKSSSRSRSRSPKKRRRRRSRSRSRRKGRSRSPKRRKNRYDTALPSSSRSPPPRQRSRSRSRGRRRRSRSPKPKARYGSRQSRSPPPPPPARSRYDTALPKRRGGHELPARPHRYAHAPGAARTPSRSPPPTKPTLSLAEQAKMAARDASR